MDLVKQLWLLKQVYSGSGYYDAQQNAHLHHIPNSMTAADLTGLEACGHAPNEMLRIEHDAAIAELQSKAAAWTVESAADAFVAALWTAPMIWQSALVGKLLANAMPQHSLTPYSATHQQCMVCGLKHGEAVDATLQWYFRMTSGTPLDGDPFGYLLAYREIEALGPPPVASHYDRWVFRAILTVLRNLPPKTRYSKAVEALKKEKLLPAKNKYVYNSLLETLALVGVLATDKYPGLATVFTTYATRDERPSVRVEVQAPLAWWDSSIGLNEAVLDHIFARFDCSDVSLTDRPPAEPVSKETLIGALEGKRTLYEKAAKTPLAAGKGPVQSGDVYAVRIREGVWVTIYCHEVAETRAKVEFLQGVFEAMPDETQLQLKLQPRTDGRWQSYVSSIDATSWVRRIARNVAMPESELPAPERIPYYQTKNLKHLASWCFSGL